MVQDGKVTRVALADGDALILPRTDLQLRRDATSTSDQRPTFLFKNPLKSLIRLRHVSTRTYLLASFVHPITKNFGSVRRRVL